MSSHSLGNSIRLKCPSCKKNFNRIWREDRGFGNCICGVPLIKQGSHFDRLVDTQRKRIENENN